MRVVQGAGPHAGTACARRRQALGAGTGWSTPADPWRAIAQERPTSLRRAWPGGRARAGSAPTRGGPTRRPRPRPRSPPAGTRRAARYLWPCAAGSHSRRPSAARSGPPRPARAPWRPGPPAAPLRRGPSARCALTLTSTLPSARCTAARPPDAGQLHRAGWQERRRAAHEGVLPPGWDRRQGGTCERASPGPGQLCNPKAHPADTVRAFTRCV